LTDGGLIATFVVDSKSGRELRQYLAAVATSCSTTATPPPAGTTQQAAVDRREVAPPPAVIILDDLQHVGSPASLADAFNSLLGLPLHHWYNHQSVT